jgi:protein-S-isoprenylcysteine O-methyltransferase Ste14
VLGGGATGLALRFAAVLQLGQRFSYSLLPQSEHGLMVSGLYSCVRHPAFLGLLLLTNMLGPFTGSWLGAIALATTIPNVLLRMSQEEQELARRFGPEYCAYYARTWRLIPFVY